LNPENQKRLMFSKATVENNKYAFSKKNGILTQPRYNTIKNEVLLIVTTKLGQEIAREDAYSMLLELMKLPSFSGCLGGTPRKARYLTGRYGNDISYLDPHYVET